MQKLYVIISLINSSWKSLHTTFSHDTNFPQEIYPAKIAYRKINLKKKTNRAITEINVSIMLKIYFNTNGKLWEMKEWLVSLSNRRYNWRLLLVFEQLWNSKN